MNEKLAERIKELRIEQGYSIQSLSKELKIGASSICRWENAKADISGSALILLADFFNVSTDYLLGRVDD